MSSVKISVVIPCWKEDLYKALAIVASMEEDPEVEWLVAMSCPPEGWKEALRKVESPHFKLVTCDQPGRGSQMNAGADKATGEALLFHHCDTIINVDHLSALKEAISQEVQAGAFHRVLDDRHPWFKPFNPIVRWYNKRWGILFGDQSFFISNALFSRLGGFKPIKLMEDVEMSRRVRKQTSVELLDPPVQTSERRSTYYGSWKVSLFNLWILFLYKLGVSTDTLHDWYYKNWNIK